MRKLRLAIFALFDRSLILNVILQQACFVVLDRIFVCANYSK